VRVLCSLAGIGSLVLLLLDLFQIQTLNGAEGLGHALDALLCRLFNSALLVARAPLLRPSQSLSLDLLVVQRLRLAVDEGQQLSQYNNSDVGENDRCNSHEIP